MPDDETDNAAAAAAVMRSCNNKTDNKRERKTGRTENGNETSSAAIQNSPVIRLKRKLSRSRVIQSPEFLLDPDEIRTIQVLT